MFSYVFKIENYGWLGICHDMRVYLLTHKLNRL